MTLICLILKKPYLHSPIIKVTHGAVISFYRMKCQFVIPSLHCNKTINWR